MALCCLSAPTHTGSHSLGGPNSTQTTEACVVTLVGTVFQQLRRPVSFSFFYLSCLFQWLVDEGLIGIFKDYKVTLRSSLRKLKKNLYSI